VALHVGDGTPDEGTRKEDAAREVGVRDVDSGVDDRDLDRRENRRLGPEVERAVKLSKEKYCSATLMLAKTAEISFEIAMDESGAT